MSLETHIPYEKQKAPLKLAEDVDETLEETLQRVCSKHVKRAKEQGIPVTVVGWAMDIVLDFYNEIK
jgi:hypothetical protein